MAAKTPLTTRGTAGYVEPYLGVYGGVCALADNIKSGTAEHLANRNGLKLSIWFFTDVDNADTWTSGIKGVKACAWQGADPDDDGGAVSLVTAATGEIGFAMQNADSEGWLWVLSAS
jgi:hypothetical protein